MNTNNQVMDNVQPVNNDNQVINNENSNIQ